MRLLLALAAAAAVACAQVQTTLGFDAPEQDLASLSTAGFTTLRHADYPSHSVRIKRNDGFCDPEVRAYSGYIDIEARHLFFYFFESRSDPANDPVLMWINGGPGCSSALGLFMELGPCAIRDGNGTTPNAYSWNRRANLFFIDQPVGVGFSYADHGEFVGTTEDAARDIAAFVGIWFNTFSRFRNRPFHMSGESYGGRYLPVFAAAVYDAADPAVNLQSVLIGNGITDFVSMALSYYDMTCTPASIAPVLPVSACVRMRAARPRCAAWLDEHCVQQFDELGCAAANAFCDAELHEPFYTTGRNPYDISQPCAGEPGDLCYPVTRHIRDYLNRETTRAALGVSDRVGNFSSCDKRVGAAFSAANDRLHASKDYVAELLERGVRVLVYAGTLDWICNWVGNARWTDALEWTGAPAFRGAELQPWEVDGKPAGLTKTAGALTFATVDGAGHMVPYDRPVQAAVMLERWLSGKLL